MYIVIIGGGRVGYYLSKALLEEGHEILIIEKNPIVCNTINEELGKICIRGDGCETTTLAEAGTERADMAVAVTSDDEDNLISCQLAKHKFHVPRTIARIRNPQNEILFKKLGVDITIITTNMIIEAISQVVPTHPMTHLLTVRDQGLEIVEVKIPVEAGSVGKAIKDLILPPNTKLILIISEDRNPQIPTAETTIEGGEQIIAVTPEGSEDALRTVLRGA
ncbi:MAG: TrkA family potassium uptake protein [Dehalococcoidales bacterium]|nr:TrkA family potassium uptake protein [Dehalococcoidales bacterium]